MKLRLQVTQTVRNLCVSSSPTILVLDSNPNLRYLYVQALERAGYKIFSASSVEEARCHLENQVIDLFLSDTHINRLDHGVGLMYEQIDKVAEKKIKTIMMSSHVQYERVCTEMGVDIFLEKPVALDRLVTLVDRLIQ